MSQALGVVILSGLAIAISPFRISAAILVMLSSKASRSGPMFVLGFALAISAVSILALTVTTQLDSLLDYKPTTFEYVVFIVIGCLLLSLGAWAAFGRSKSGPQKTPAWLEKIEGLSSKWSILIGAGMAVFSFKDLGLIIAATVAIGAAEINNVEASALLLLFIVLSTLGVATPVIWRLTAGARAEPDLERMRKWLLAHNSLLLGCSLMVFGALILARGALGLWG